MLAKFQSLEPGPDRPCRSKHRTGIVARKPLNLQALRERTPRLDRDRSPALYARPSAYFGAGDGGLSTSCERWTGC